jgi:hypothetical protein
MFGSGLFDGMEAEVSAGADTIGSILRGYPFSNAGRAAKAVFSNNYWHFFGTICEGLRQSNGEASLLLRAHMVGRLYFDPNLLGLVLYRSFRRVLYCKCFNGIELAQMKQAGLYAYWITKMHPIVVNKAPDELEKLSAPLEKGLLEINERFAFYLIRAFFRDEFGRELPNSDEYQKHFVHAARMRSFTEDSMMLVSESLGVAGRSL